MTVEHLIAFNVALLAAIVSPGPAFLVGVRMTLSAGRTAGIAVGCGLGLMAATWTLMALLGLDAVFYLFPWLYAVAKTAGAIYVLYVAYQMWRSARNPIGSAVQPARHAFRQGVLINLLNPKSVLFAAAVLVVVFPAEMSAVENTMVVANHFLVEILFYCAIACAMSSRLVGQRYLRAKVYIDRTASAILSALGLRLLVSARAVTAEQLR